MYVIDICFLDLSEVYIGFRSLVNSLGVFDRLFGKYVY